MRSRTETIILLVLTVTVGAFAIWSFLNFGQRADESYARNKGGRVRAELQRLSLAIEEYRVDHGSYPAHLHQITTPNAYTSAVAGDPFGPSNQWHLQWESRPDAYRLWSLGPDGDNDGMQILYDPTNGILSEGDIGVASGEWE